MANDKDKIRSAMPTRRDRIIRTVATSTAIETGEPVRKIEERLRSRKGRFKDLTLARMVAPWACSWRPSPPD